VRHWLFIQCFLPFIW